MRQYVIIGMGPAGIAAAEAIRSKDALGKIILVGEESAGFYSRPGLAYYLTGEIGEAQLFPYSEKDYKDLSFKRVSGRVTRVQPSEHRVCLDQDATMHYDRLLIATGAAAARASYPGIDANGVLKLDNLEDANRIIKYTHKGRTAVVIGGGITALELVEAFIARGMKTHYFLRGERYWGNVLDEVESEIVENRLRDEGVHIHYNTELAEILQREGRVVGVRTKTEQTIPCNLVGVAIGVLPRKEIAEASGLKTGRGILVNQFLETSDPDVFSAGDVCEVFDPISGKSLLDSLWSSARDQGTVAGMNMAGGNVAYSKLVPFNVTRLAHLTTTIIGNLGSGRDEDLVGIARGDSETWRQTPNASVAQANEAVNRLRVLVGKTSLVGALIMGDQTLSRALTHLIAHQIDITSIRDQLLHPDAPVAGIITKFWSAHKGPS